MPNGAYALYLDQSAGGGPNAPVDRVVLLPRLGDGQLEFDRRRVTVVYDNLPAGAPNAVTVTGRFLGGTGGPINVTINAGQCLVLDVPHDACAATLHVNPPPAGTARGLLSVLVEYKDS